MFKLQTDDMVQSVAGQNQATMHAATSSLAVFINYWSGGRGLSSLICLIK